MNGGVSKAMRVTNGPLASGHQPHGHADDHAQANPKTDHPTRLGTPLDDPGPSAAIRLARLHARLFVQIGVFRPNGYLTTLRLSMLFVPGSTGGCSSIDECAVACARHLVVSA